MHYLTPVNSPQAVIFVSSTHNQFCPSSFGFNCSSIALPALQRFTRVTESPHHYPTARCLLGTSTSVYPLHRTETRPQSLIINTNPQQLH
jgi:hypothetical protein